VRRHHLFCSKSSQTFLATATGGLITKISEATAKDVDLAVEAAHRAFETTWGLNAPGTKRAALLNKLAQLMEAHADELAALEGLDNGEILCWLRHPVMAYLTALQERPLLGPRTPIFQVR
jgi:aldehyde dehydrogenase (NAD+)